MFVGVKNVIHYPAEKKDEKIQFPVMSRLNYYLQARQVSRCNSQSVGPLPDERRYWIWVRTFQTAFKGKS